MKKVDSILLNSKGEILQKIESPWQHTYVDDNMKVIHVNDNSQSMELYMNYCGQSDCAPGHSFGPAVRDHYVIHYIVSGEGTLTIDDKEYHLKENQGFLLCPNVVSKYKASEKNPWSYMWVGFHGLNAGSYLQSANLDTENPIFTYTRDDSIKYCIGEMVNIHDNYKNGSNLRLQSLLYRLLAELVENSTSGYVVENMPIQHRYIQKCISYIQMNYMDDLSVNSLAEYVGLDRSYLSSIFKKCLNTPPQAYIAQYRINKACDLLKNTSYSIAEISMMIGYKDPVVFQKFFKNIIGISPNKYRKQQ